MKILLLVVASVLLVATAAVAGPKKVFLTVHTDPDGARVSADGFSGVAPFRLQYAVPAKDCTVTHPITVTWASGATATAAVNLCAAVGKNQSYTVVRPITEPRGR
jgi:hypothetical protein